MAGHDLEDVAGADVGLGALDDLAIGAAADRRGQLSGPGRFERRAAGGQGAGEIGRHGRNARTGGLIGCSRRPTVWTHGRHQQGFLGDGIEHGHDRRSDQNRVRQVERVRIDVRQAFGQPDHVVAEDPEETSGHRGQAGRQGDARGRGRFA